MAGPKEGTLKWFAGAFKTLLPAPQNVTKVDRECDGAR